MTHIDSYPLPKPLLLIIAFIQGLMLLALYRSVDAHYWPWQQPLYFYPLLTFALVAPTLGLLSFTQGQVKAYLPYISVFTLLSVAVAFYTGWNLEPGDTVNASTIGFIFWVTMILASFKALMYVQQRGDHQPMSYGLLFRLSWRNFLVISLALLFMLIFWGILFLCGELFEVINIKFIAELIKKDWFYFPVLALAHGFGVILFRNMAKAIDMIASLLKVLMKFLLPALVLIAAAFLMALPFTGLQTLWGTGHGSMLILWLQVLMLFFTNAVYQDEHQASPYHLIIHRFIYAGIALLPIYSAVAFVGLYARISQYGFSVERCWALLIWALLAMFALGYLWGVVKKRDQWIAVLSRVNIAMGLVVLGTMLLVNSPLLDFRKIALNSQLRQLETGKVTSDKFDVSYIHRNLGRPGYFALQDLKQARAKTDEILVSKITQALAKEEEPLKNKPSETEFIAMLHKHPAELQVPELLLHKLYEKETASDWNWKHLKNLHILATDLNGDGLVEYAYFDLRERWSGADLWCLENNDWKKLSMSGLSQLSGEYIEQRLINDKTEAASHKWQKLKIGELMLSVDGND